jgi:hypothetical protein
MNSKGAVPGMAGSLGHCFERETNSQLLHRQRDLPFLFLHFMVERLSVISREIGKMPFTCRQQFNHTPSTFVLALDLLQSERTASYTAAAEFSGPAAAHLGS